MSCCLENVERLETVDVRATDTIVATVPPDLPEADRAQTARALREVFPRNRILLTVKGELEIEVQRAAAEASA